MKITSDENVNQAVEQMVQAIRNTDAYLEYQKQLARVKEQSELKSRSMNSGPETLNCRPARTPTLISWISLPEKTKLSGESTGVGFSGGGAGILPYDEEIGLYVTDQMHFE